MAKTKIRLLLIFLMAICSNAIGQIDSIRIIKSEIELLRSSPNFNEKDTQHIDLINRLGQNIIHFNTDTINVLSTEALQLSEITNYKKGRIGANYNKGVYLIYSGKIDEAINLFSTIIEDNIAKPYPRLMANIHSQLGKANYFRGNYSKAYKSMLLAVEFAEEAKDQILEVRFIMNLGTVCSLMTDYDQALKYYKVALDKSNSIKGDIDQAVIQNNLGYLYLQKNEFQTALNYLNNGISIFEKEDPTTFLAFAYNTKAEVYNKLLRHDEAVRIFKKSEKIVEELNYTKGKADMFYGLGISNLGLKDVQKAEDYFLSSLNFYQANNIKSSIERSYRALYTIKKIKGDLPNALKYLELAQTMSDSLALDIQKREINMFQAKLDFEADKKIIQLLKDNEISKQRWYTAGTGALLAIAIVIALIIFRSNSLKNKLNNLLKEKTKTLTKQRAELNSINTNQDKLFTIVGHDLKGPITSFKELLTLYIEDPEGKIYFDNFAPKLKKDLTQMESTLDNILEWGKGQMKGFSINPETIKVKPISDEIIGFFDTKLTDKNIKIDNSLDEELMVFADQNHFKVIFRNLIANAIKFTPNLGTIIISADRQDSTLTIKIKDSGVGMSQDVINKLFKSSEHHSTYGTNDEKGTGIGLWLTREMVDKNNGHIHVESIEGKGSTFFVSLPLFNALPENNS